MTAAEGGPVAIIMGSQSDWATMRHAADTLDSLGVPHRALIVSAHRTPDRLVAFAKGARAAGLQVIIAGAGGAAHLPGMVASMSPLPVFGVPVETHALGGLDSLYSIVQMPAGVPVGTLAIGRAGAVNAALLAAAVLALHDPALAGRLDAFRARQSEAVAAVPQDLEAVVADPAVSPGDTLGILGGGQLGRMLAMAAAALGLKSHIFAPEADSPAFGVADLQTVADYRDEAALARFARSVAVVTYEFENVPAETAAILSRHAPVRPNGNALKTAQDRLVEKQFIRGLGLETAPFVAVDDPGALARAVAQLGRPSILKTRRFGYDGKGQALVREGSDLAVVFRSLGQKSILEGVVPFIREVSMVVARGVDGGFRAYELNENVHANGILATTTVPAAVTPETERLATEMARRIADALDYVGVLTVEMFVLPAGSGGSERLVVNEIAPRVHNSGHWTLGGAVTSQFEQHVRAVCGWPLGSTQRFGAIAMRNLIGDDVNAWRAILAEPGASLYLYGKAQPRPGRKMGHVTRVTPDPRRQGG